VYASPGDKPAELALITTSMHCMATQSPAKGLGNNISLGNLLNHDQLASSNSQNQGSAPRAGTWSAAGSAASAASSHLPSPHSRLTLSLRGEVFHVFFSYRVKTESDLVGELYHKLMMSVDAAKIPDISKWPSKFKQPPKEVAASRLHVFWDSKCLAPGLTWKDNGFVAALSKALVFLPLLSDGVVEKWCHPVQDFVDNVLLELILALEFNALSEQQPSEVYPCKFIMPVFVNDLFKKLGALSQAPARETMTEASRILEAFGFSLSRDHSPHSVISALATFQGVEMHVYHDKLRQQALDVVVKEAFTAVTMCIQGSSSFIDDFVAHHPRAQELCDWLHELNLSRYTGVIARHGITSVYAFSLLDAGSAIPALAEDCALGCGQTRVHAIGALSRALALAKCSLLSLPLSQRCSRFIDTEASLLSAMFSSCGVDSILTKPRFLVLAFLNAVACLGAGVLTLGMNEQPFLIVNAAMNPLFWFLLSTMFLCCSTWPFAHGGSFLNVPSSEFKPHTIVACFCVLCCCYGLIALLYMKVSSFDSVDIRHSILCVAAVQKGTLSVSFNACYLYEIAIFLVQVVLISALGYSVCFKQEIACRMLMCGGIFLASSLMGFNEMGVINHQAFVRVMTISFVALLVGHLAGFEILNWYSKKKASKLLQDDENEYHSKWNALMLDAHLDGSSGHSEATALSAYIRQHHRDVVDELESRLFKQRPEVLQEHSSIDTLFEDAECVDVCFQELVQCWLKVRLTLHLSCFCFLLFYMECRVVIERSFSDSYKSSIWMPLLCLGWKMSIPSAFPVR
jgi:hypothetical protein